MKESLGDYILDRTESLENELILKYYIERDNTKILRLTDSEQYLIEGSRGVGKTMLMKAAMLKSESNFGQNSILPVWVSFEESIRLERIRVVDNSVDPFLQWTMGKILFECLNKIAELQPKSSSTLNERLSKIFNVPHPDTFSKYTSLLNDYIRILEKGDVEDNNTVTKFSPSQELTAVLDNPQSFREFLLDIIKDYKLQRIVFLFDEAAHVFSFSQQEKFFTFFKSLRNPLIACKAAVYPGVTNYGKYFERGQDAKEIRIDWSPLDKNDINYIKEIIKKRIKAYKLDYWNKLTANNTLDLLAICSNGNPRFAFHILDELENNKAFKANISTAILINSIRTVFNTKWREFDTLKKRLVRYEKYISEAESFIKGTILPNLRIWNDKQRLATRKLSIGFYISTGAFDKLEKVFSVLAYSNIIGVDYSKRSVGHHKYGFYVTINPSILFTDLIIKDVNELENTSIAIENNQTYTESTSSIKEIMNQIGDVSYISCSNTLCDFKTKEDFFKFCPKCGAEIESNEEESLYKILRSHNIDNLKLSSKLITRIKTKFSNIGELYDCDVEDLRMKYIQDVRINAVRNVVLEYMSG